MLKIKTTGVEDYLDGSANIKALLIGGPGAGKTRTSSYWPRPIYLDCENGRGSLADRNMPYAEIKSSKDMLDALDYLKGLERTPKAQRQFQTVVVDTIDSFQRIVKEEWVTANKAAAFTGFDAWGYLDTKMQLLLTRLLNLDFNVVTLSHFEVMSYKDGDNTVRELKLQLQGKISEQIFNDFGLVGWLGTYWAPENGERVQKRGLTFHPTPDKPFLKDRFGVTPKMMPINFSETDYNQIWEAFTSRADFETMPEATVVGEIPDARVVNGQVVAPGEGGPLGTPMSRPAPAIAEDVIVPLEKRTNQWLMERAKELGLAPKGNALKSELVTMIQKREADLAVSKDAPSGSPETPATTPTTVTPSPSASASSNSTSTEPSSPAVAEKPAAAPPAAASASTESATPNEDEAVALVAEELGGEVISEERTDAPVTPQSAPPSAPASKPAAPQGPSACADCGDDLSEAWGDPAKKNVMRMSFVKHRKYLCTECYGKN
jgi:hypothetical protein